MTEPCRARPSRGAEKDQRARSWARSTRRSISLPLFTVIIGALDSFNPCAFFVLLFLLSMLIHARSRKKMFLIGGIFVFFSGFIYFLFMAAWLNVFLVIGRLT